MPTLRGPQEHYADIKKMREFMSQYKVVTLEQFDKYLRSSVMENIRHTPSKYIPNLAYA